VEAEFGNERQAREEAAAAVTSAHGRRAVPPAVVALSLVGSVNEAQSLGEEITKRYPKDTIINSLMLPSGQAAVELNRGNSAKVIELLQSASPYELAGGPNAAPFLPIYIRGQAFLRERKGTEGAVEFQKILDHRGVAPTSPLYALAYLGLARASALAGDTAKTRRAYQDFLALWKDADPDIPIFQEAKAEYAKLP
jgi:predicted Zn-dependent protease